MSLVRQRNPNLPGTAAARYGGGNRLTAMNAAHDAFVRDLQRLTVAARSGRETDPLADPDRHRSILAGWDLFTGMLEIHHQAEDTIIWPRLRHRLAHSSAALSVLAEMDAEHARIDPLVAAVSAGLAARGTVDVAPMIEQLRSTLAEHLRHEEREAMPMIAEALSDREWRAVVRVIHQRVSAMDTLSVTDFLPWLTEGHSARQEKAITSIVPAPIRPVYRLVWKPRYRRVARW
jgi:iron-sulfur cluster repair protein YtfE (RIC family)